MTKIQSTIAAKIMRSVQHRTLIRRGRDFMRARQAFVKDADCLTSMIMACIAEGARTRDDIIRNVPSFVGFRYAQVAYELDHGTGASADEGHWYRDEDKVYHLHVATQPGRPRVELKLGRVHRKSKPVPLLPEKMSD